MTQSQASAQHQLHDPLDDGISSVQYVTHAGDDLSTVNAARVSLAGYEQWETTQETTKVAGDNPGEFEYMIKSGRVLSKRSKKLLRYLIRHGHWSPFEHAFFSVRVKAPIFVRTQMYRHWSIKPNEVSGRYVELKDESWVPTPGDFRKQAPSNRQASVADDGTIDQDAAHLIYKRNWENSYRDYQQLLALGVTREQARGVLPQAMYTEFLFSGTVRNWLHFFGARIHEGAQYETQVFAEAIREIFEAFFSESLTAYVEIEAEKAENQELADRYRELKQ